MIVDAVATSAEVVGGYRSPETAIAAAIERARAVNPTINAIVEPAYERALEKAAGAGPAGSLAGVPILLKDLFCPAEGDTAYQGNRTLKDQDYRYPVSGAVVRRLENAGAVSIGRSHSPELGCGQCPAAAETALYGPARNPWNPEYSPLGSSGGAAAAVAAGVVPLAHASDGGGSIRIPASANGLIGLKCSRGRISAAPAGELWAGGVTDGVVSRSVRDTALALDVLAGPEPGDPHWVPPPARSYRALAGEPPPRLRIGLCTALPYTETAPGCAAAAREAADLLSDLGHRVERAHPEPMNRLDYMYDYIRVIRVSLVTELRMFEAGLGRPWRAEDVEEGTWINYQRGLKVSGADVFESRERLHRFTREMLAWWHQGFDLLLTSTLATEVPRVGHLVEGDERLLTRRLAAVTPFLPQFNVTGQPAISVPMAAGDNGVPIGV